MHSLCALVFLFFSGSLCCLFSSLVGILSGSFSCSISHTHYHHLPFLFLRASASRTSFHNAFITCFLFFKVVLSLLNESLCCEFFFLRLCIPFVDFFSSVLFGTVECNFFHDWCEHISGICQPSFRFCSSVCCSCLLVLSRFAFPEFPNEFTAFLRFAWLHSHSPALSRQSDDEPEQESLFFSRSSRTPSVTATTQKRTRSKDKYPLSWPRSLPLSDQASFMLAVWLSTAGEKHWKIDKGSEKEREEYEMLRKETESMSMFFTRKAWHHWTNRQNALSVQGLTNSQSRWWW